jgi:hypothetical protein
MKNNKCSKSYPKEFKSETQVSNDGYHKYRRRTPEEGGFTVTKSINGREVTVDNRWIVPHSPYLTRMFEAHINVEVCSSIKSIKYVLKYIHKGCDMAAFKVEKNAGAAPNEIENYISARYVSSVNACWRIFSFPIHDHFPAVMSLQVHLKNGQRVVYKDEESAKKNLKLLPEQP